MRCESITIDDVVCPVRGAGPRPQNILVYNYPYEGDELYLHTVLSEFGDVQDVRFPHWLEIPGVADGVRVVTMIRKKAIPRHLTIDGFFCKVSYYGQTLECDICRKTGHIARDCPLKGKCLECLQSGHLQRDCPTRQTRAPPVLASGELVPHAGHSESSDSSSASSDSGSSSDHSMEAVDDANLNESSSNLPNVTQQKSGDLNVTVAQQKSGDLNNSIINSNVAQHESGDLFNNSIVAQQRSGDLFNVSQHQSGEPNVTVAQEKSGDLLNSNGDQSIINSNVAQQESGDSLNVAQQKSGDLSIGSMEHNVSNLSVARQKSGDLTNDNIEQNVVNLSVTQQKSGDLINEQNLVDLNATQELSGDLSYDNCSSLAQQLVGEMFEGESRPSADEVILSDTSPLSGVASPVLFSEDVEIPWADRVEEEEEDKEHSCLEEFVLVALLDLVLLFRLFLFACPARDGYELVLYLVFPLRYFFQPEGCFN